MSYLPFLTLVIIEKTEEIIRYEDIWSNR